jgi:hypothetical protein
MQCNKFSGNLSKELSKPKQRLVREMIYGIQASKDVKLSNICRALQEPIDLIKTEDRLSRNLNDEDFTDHINEHLLRLGDDKVNESMVIAIDPGDIEKPYAKAMEHLCRVYDGSEHEMANGYHLCQVTAANLEHNKIVPLYCEAYSSKEEGYINATEKINSIISTVVQKIGTKGTWAIDRQGDNLDIIQHFEKEQLEFVTRLKRNRYLHFNHNTARQVKAERIHHFVKFTHTMQMVQIEESKLRYLTLQYGALQVALPEAPDQWYTLIVVQGFGEQPMLLLTNKKVNQYAEKGLWHIIEIYLTRWKCDECYRYIKQSYNLEDLRVRSYISIRNITAFVHAIAYFCSVYLGMSLKLKLMAHKLFVCAKRFFGIPAFYNYAMADGVYELLRKARKGITEFKGKTGKNLDSFQLELFPQ